MLNVSIELVYKLLQKGDLPAIRIASSWRINCEKFEQWISLRQLVKPEIVSIVNDLDRRLKAHYKSQYVALYLYGSAARGEMTSDSDVDLLILLTHIDDHWKERHVIRKMAYEETYDKGRAVLLSTNVATPDELANRQEPIFCRIREEGVRAA